MLKRYLEGIFNTGKRGDAREESYYETLAVLLRDAATSSGKSKFHITTLPKSTEAGNPDFRVWDGKQHIVGYIEAKTPTVDNLLKKGYAHKNGVKDGGYYQVDGKPLGEKNPKWLQDDYVKFIRFSQWKIDQAGIGVLGFITNHTYLDNPTFRGMRRSLMNSFDEVYILDLHGNSLKKETCPDGSKDENVFDIRQGVAIGLFIKSGKKDKTCRMFHSEIWGLRENKYDWLESHGLQNTDWNEISPKSGVYLFIPRDEKLLTQYEVWPKVTDIFPVNISKALKKMPGNTISAAIRYATNG